MKYKQEEISEDYGLKQQLWREEGTKMQIEIKQFF